MVDVRSLGPRRRSSSRRATSPSSASTRPSSARRSTGSRRRPTCSTSTSTSTSSTRTSSPRTWPRSRMGRTWRQTVAALDGSSRREGRGVRARLALRLPAAGRQVGRGVDRDPQAGGRALGGDLERRLGGVDGDRVGRRGPDGRRDRPAGRRLPSRRRRASTRRSSPTAIVVAGQGNGGVVVITSSAYC